MAAAEQPRPASVLVAVDGSQHGTEALRWAARELWREGVQLDLVAVLPPVALNVQPIAPVATAAAFSAITHQWEAQKAHDEQHATEVLRGAVQEALDAGVPKQCLHAHALPAAGGASGVGDSIVEFAKAKGASVVVVGSRGMGSLQRSLMSFVGLGSVGDYVTHQLHVPVVVVHAAAAAAAGAAADRAAAAEAGEGARAAPRRLCVALDDSVHSQYALDWLRRTVLRSGDEVHVAVVALPVPYPILDETSAAVAALEAQQWRASTESSLAYARGLAAKAAVGLKAAAAAAGLEGVEVKSAPLLPEGGASDVGASICKYAQEHKVDLVVLGSRGMGSFKRSLMGFIGLGSVSDHCLHNLQVPVAVVKCAPEDLPPAAASGAAQEAHDVAAEVAAAAGGAAAGAPAAAAAQPAAVKED